MKKLHALLQCLVRKQKVHKENTLHQHLMKIIQDNEN